MSFWEEFGQRITKESQRALQRTRDLASVVTINADISDSKRKINDLYQELGQLVVNEAFTGVTADQLQSALSDENADETVREIRLTNWQEIYSKVMFIRSEEEVIAINESKISELKSESRCPYCGKTVTAVFSSSASGFAGTLILRSGSVFPAIHSCPELSLSDTLNSVTVFPESHIASISSSASTAATDSGRRASADPAVAPSHTRCDIPWSVSA